MVYQSVFMKVLQISSDQSLRLLFCKAVIRAHFPLQLLQDCRYMEVRCGFPHRFQAQDLEVQLSDELAASLRQLKVHPLPPRSLELTRIQ